MKLMTKELEKRFEQVGSQEGTKDPIVIAHYFNPTGGGDWYALEYKKADNVIFCYASLFHDENDELGYTSLNELAEYKGRLGLGIERDLYWREKPLSQACSTFTV